MVFYKEKDSNIVVTEKELNKDYIEIKANETDGALEKHVPVYEIVDNKINVRIGSIPHPMSEEHYIMWIALVNDEEIIKIELVPGVKPEAEFEYISGSTIYAYCNLHGLWKTDVK